jgi:hypothetical protein
MYTKSFTPIIYVNMRSNVLIAFMTGCTGLLNCQAVAKLYIEFNKPKSMSKMPLLPAHMRRQTQAGKWTQQR